MKKIIFILTLISITSYESYALSNKSKNPNVLYSGISQLKNRGLRSLAFSSLSKLEKKMLWDYKFKKLFNKYRQNSVKFDYVNKVYNLYKNINYNENSKQLNTNLLIDNAPILFNQGREIFNDPLDLINIFFELVPVDRNDLQKISIEDSSKLINKFRLYPCECIAGKPGGCFATLPDGQVIFGTCYDKYCEKPPGSGGCGWFGSEPCDAYRCGFF